MQFDPLSVTKEERNKLCNECLMKVQSKNNLPGLNFIVDALKLNIPSAVIDLAQIIINGAGNREDCLQFLTKEEAAERRLHWLGDYQNDKLFPKSKNK